MILYRYNFRCKVNNFSLKYQLIPFFAPFQEGFLRVHALSFLLKEFKKPRFQNSFLLKKARQSVP